MRPPPRALALAVLLALPLAASASAGPPAENECPLLGGRPGAPPAEDAVVTRLREGLALGWEDVLRLAQLLPREVWSNREVFFHPGMRMEIGACHRRYPTAKFYAEATERFAGRARLDEHGNLWDYVAGLPFAPDAIDAGRPDAGLRWAWNFEQRYRGAGPSGHFRIVDMPSRVGSVQTYYGEFFLLKTRHRADLAERGYALAEADGRVWVAGGRFVEPFSVRHLAWRQLRPVETERDYDEPDDTFVYVPTMRKMRRSASTTVDGMFMPRYRVSGDTAGGGIAVGGDFTSGPQGSINPNAAESTVVTEHLRRGFEGLALRPNAYRWRVLTEREVLAPLNGTRGGYPLEKERNFGSNGLSVGSDRWDVRYAVVLRGEALDPRGDFRFMDLWVDWQTQQPLYQVTRDSRSRIVDVTILVHHYSGDRAYYPAWPDGTAAAVFDPVAAVSFSPLEGGTGWRRESYDVQSVPPDPETLRSLTSTDSLLRGR